MLQVTLLLWCSIDKGNKRMAKTKTGKRKQSGEPEAPSLPKPPAHFGKFEMFKLQVRLSSFKQYYQQFFKPFINPG